MVQITMSFGSDSKLILICFWPFGAVVVVTCGAAFLSAVSVALAVVVLVDVALFSGAEQPARIPATTIAVSTLTELFFKILTSQMGNSSSIAFGTTFIVSTLRLSITWFVDMRP